MVLGDNLVKPARLSTKPLISDELKASCGRDQETSYSNSAPGRVNHHFACHTPDGNSSCLSRAFELIKYYVFFIFFIS